MNGSGLQEARLHQQAMSTASEHIHGHRDAKESELIERVGFSTRLKPEKILAQATRAPRIHMHHCLSS